MLGRQADEFQAERRSVEKVCSVTATAELQIMQRNDRHFGQRFLLVISSEKYWIFFPCCQGRAGFVFSCEAHCRD